MRGRPGSERLRQLDLQGHGGRRRGAEAGARLETQGAAFQSRKVDSQQAEEREEQHGHGPFTGSRGGAQRPGVEDDHGHHEDGADAAEAQAERPDPGGPRLGQGPHSPGDKELQPEVEAAHEEGEEGPGQVRGLLVLLLEIPHYGGAQGTEDSRAQDQSVKPLSDPQVPEP